MNRRPSLSAARSALIATTLGLTVLLAATTTAAAADIGFRDHSYAPISGSPTGSKPESKLWFYRGWWASMFHPSSGDHHIYKLDPTTQTFTDTGTAIDARDSSRADALWDASSNKLYVASHVFTTSPASSTSNNGRLWRFSYSAATDRYTLDSGFPVNINTAKTETLVIARDSTGTLWATWMLGNRIYVNHTTGSDTSWGTPYILPTAGTTVSSDDISSVIAFGGNKIGVMWSNQADGRFYFAVHTDGTGDAAGDWSATAIPGTASSDDHINLKTDSTGRVYAAVKHSTTGGSSPLVSLLVRSAAGSWTSHTFGRGSDSHTRPIVVLDEPQGTVHMFATCPQPPNTSGQSGGDICEKTSPMGTISFAPGIGTAVIRHAGSPDMNDATSTKQNVDASTGLVVQANNATTKYYWHAYQPLGAVPPPLAADFAGTPTSGAVPLSVSFTDTSTGGPTAWSWNFGDGGTSNQQNPTHVYATPGTYTVSLTVTDGAGGSDTRTRTGYIVAGSTGGTKTFKPTADAQVKSTSAATNYGTLTTLRVRQGTSPTATTYRTYLKFAVSGLTGAVTGAKLRLFVTDPSSDGGRVYAASTGWSESTLNWNNAPPLVEPPIATIGATSATGTWTQVDLGGAISGDGTYSLALANSSTNSAIYSSREGTNAPELVLTTS